jgi:hypothetical protein
MPCSKLIIKKVTEQETRQHQKMVQRKHRMGEQEAKRMEMPDQKKKDPEMEEGKTKG